MESDRIPLVLAELQFAMFRCQLSRTFAVTGVLSVTADVAEVVEKTADDETVFWDLVAHTASYLVGLECVVGHSAGVSVVTVTRSGKEVTVLKKCNHILDTLSIG